MGLKVPMDVARPVIEGRADLGFSCADDGTVTGEFETGFSGTPYPPPGYLPWNRLEVGDGDTYGFYWPIGREDQPPIVCTLMHDSGELMPLASSLEAVVRLHAAVDLGDTDEWLAVADEFGIDVAKPRKARRRDDDDDDEEEDDESEGRTGGIPYWGVPSAGPLLAIDLHSPPLLVQGARELLATATPDFAAAEEMLLKALDLLPEYTAAWLQLVQLRRRQKAPGWQVIDAMLNAITSPLAFGHFERQKCLASLQKLTDSADPDCIDPIWHHRRRLSFATEVKDHGDHEVFEQAIEAYHELGMHVRAVRLRILAGELMGAETVSFRERKQFTWPAYWAALRNDVERAGLLARLPLLHGPWTETA
jgi:hypothetical protein